MKKLVYAFFKKDQSEKHRVQDESVLCSEIIVFLVTSVFLVCL